MPDLKNIPVLIFTLSAALQTLAHPVVDDGNLELIENRKPKERTILNIPDVDGYMTLKCDLHMHTVFSDGLVWPSIRVEEAWREGLDAIAITDHLENSPHKEDIPVNHNRPYEIAKGASELTDILLIRGSEITRQTPPGHFNAIFVTDSSVLQTEKQEGNLELDKLAIEKAAQQDAFIFWNHPGWKVNSIEGSYEWIEFINTIHQEGKLHGIEVINGFHYHRKSLDWALEHDLAVLGTSDIHNLIANDYDMERGVTRSMTLVFAEDRSVEGIREALEKKRTVAWSTNLMAGREKWIRKLYEASVTIGSIYARDSRGWAYASISNDSDFRFEMELVQPADGNWPNEINLNPETSQVLKFKPTQNSETARYVVKNAYIGGYKNLEVEIQVSE